MNISVVHLICTFTCSYFRIRISNYFSLTDTLCDVLHVKSLAFRRYNNAVSKASSPDRTSLRPQILEAVVLYLRLSKKVFVMCEC